MRWAVLSDFGQRDSTDNIGTKTKMNSFNKGYALILGVAEYRLLRNLPSVILEDTWAIQNVLTDPSYAGYPEQQIHHLINEQVTLTQAQNGFAWLTAQTGVDDTAIIYFSGHGGQVETGLGVENYLLLHDTDPAHLSETAISGQQLTDWLRRIQAGRLLVLFDCCHAGGVGQAKDAGQATIPTIKAGLNEDLYARLGGEKGRAIIASSRSDEYSWVLPGMPNSLFTHYLLQALRGEAPTRGDGFVRLFDVFDYVSQKVTAQQPEQHPLFKAELENKAL